MASFVLQKDLQFELEIHKYKKISCEKSETIYRFHAAHIKIVT